MLGLLTGFWIKDGLKALIYDVTYGARVVIAAEFGLPTLGFIPLLRLFLALSMGGGSGTSMSGRLY